MEQRRSDILSAGGAALPGQQQRPSLFFFFLRHSLQSGDGGEAWHTRRGDLRRLGANAGSSSQRCAKAQNLEHAVVEAPIFFKSITIAKARC